MAEVLIPDAGGSTLRLMDYGGRNYGCFYFREETLKSIHTLPLRRSDDILLCYYPKTGCHWTWEIVQMLLDGNMTRANHMQKEHAMLENLTEEEGAKLESPRILNTHMLFSEMPQEGLKKHRNRIIFVYRNPKDVAVSFYYMHRSGNSYQYNGKFDDYLSLYFSVKSIIGDWRNHFTVDKNEKIDAIIQERLSRVQLEFKYDL